MPIRDKKNKGLTLQKLAHFAALDLETMDVNGNQYPVSIAITYSSTGILGKPITKLFTINKEAFVNSPESAVLDMFRDFLKYLEGPMINYNSHICPQLRSF